MPMPKFERYICNVFLGIDYFVNVLLLGDPDDSISERLGRAMLSGKPKFFVPPVFNFVNFMALHIFGQENHCQKAVYTYPVPNELWNWSKK